MDTAYRIDIMARTGIISRFSRSPPYGYLWGGSDPLGGNLAGLDVVGLGIVDGDYLGVLLPIEERRLGETLSIDRRPGRKISLLIPTLSFVSNFILFGHGPF